MLAAAALLATSVAPAVARTLDSQVSQDRGPDAKDSDGSRGGDLEPVDVNPLDGPQRGFKLSLGTGTEPRTYLIRLQDAAVPTYAGEKPGLAPTAPERGAQLESDSPASRAYVAHLEQVQVEFVQRLERTVGRAVEVPFTYQFAVNGLAAVLTPEEALQIAADPAVASISLDQGRELQTDSGPPWLGAEAVWNGMTDLGLPENVKGEGIVIGTIDTGISPGNSSFADVGDDGYDHTNPLGAGNYLGACDPANAAQFDPDFVCNDKLIGAYVFGAANETAVDYDGHGSHTSSTSGGNVVNDVVVTTAAGFVTPPFDISGVAPHANIISYLGCCTLAGLTAAIDQAIADEVDAINYSIGSDSPSALWSDFDAVGFLNARAAGIFVATSNGNAGPGFATTGSPADAPWILSVGASTHNRHNGNILTGLTRDDATTLPAIPGKSVTGALATPTPITYAGAVGDPFCEDTTSNEAAFTGRIVICDRGGASGRVQKSSNVAGQGAIGFVLVNDANHGDSLLGDEYALPGVFIAFDDGQALKAWLAAGSGHVATIAGTEFAIDDARGDIMASFSSRGPNRAVDVIVPSVTAPGVDILAAHSADSYAADEHGFISGTSMASPHGAGSGALMTQARPDWTPAQMQSALMSTARSTILNHDGTAATPYAQGSGHINVAAAVMAGLLFDETPANYVAANPAEGGHPKTLNLPSFADGQCLGTCSWQRTATVPINAAAPVPAGVAWTASATSDAGMALSVGLTPTTVSPGESMAISVSANVTGDAAGETLFGRVTLTPSNASVPAVTMPVAVVPTSGILPGAVDVETPRNAGSHLITGIESIALSEFTGSVEGMVRATQTVGSLSQDPTRTDVYDDLSQVAVHLVEVPEGATRLVAETFDTEMPDLDMFVGTGTTPSLATEVCTSTSPTATERCDVADPAAGTWWVIIQNWEASASQPDAYTLATAAVPGDDLGNAGVDGPEGPLAAGEPYDIRFHWDIPAMVAGDRYYGTVVLGSSPATPGDIGSFPVNLIRAGDDVAKTASASEATFGDTVSYEITVQPNVTPTDLVYTIVDTVPDGLTIDPASVTGGGVVDGQTITWEVLLPSPVGKESSYVSSTPATSAQCAAWTGFFDLGTIGIPFAGLDGDSVAANAFSGIGPFNHYGEDFPNLTVAEDGLITMAGGYGGDVWEAQAIPNAAAPNGVLAPLWSDLELSIANGRGMRLAQSTADGVAIVQWDNPFEWTADDTVGPSVGKFQAWIYNSVEDFRPEMTFEYGTVGALPGVATIGTESMSGDLATAILGAGDPAGVVTPSPTGSFCLDYEGPSFDPITVGYDVTVHEDALTGTYTNQASHITDDPYAEVVLESFDLEVDGNTVTSLNVSPSTAKLKAKAATQKFTAEAELSGGGTIDVTDRATWSSGNEDVATIDASGLATAVGGGKAIISASFAGEADTAEVQVSGKPSKRGAPPL